MTTNIEAEWLKIRLTFGPNVSADEIETMRHVFVAGVVAMRLLVTSAADAGIEALEQLDSDIGVFAESLTPRLELHERTKRGVM